MPVRYWLTQSVSKRAAIIIMSSSGVIAVGILLVVVSLVGSSPPDPYASNIAYSFSYDVVDPYSGQDFGHEESRKDDSVKGEYHVLLPDDRTQVVRYQADHNGYIADVKYDYKDPSYGSNKYKTGSHYGNDYNKYPESSYAKPNKYPSESPAYGKGGSSSKYVPKPTSYGPTTPSYYPPTYGAGYPSGTTDGYTKSGTNDRNRGHYQSYGGVGDHSDGRAYGQSYLANYVATGTPGYGSYQPGYGCKCP